MVMVRMLTKMTRVGMPESLTIYKETFTEYDLFKKPFGESTYGLCAVFKSRRRKIYLLLNTLKRISR